MKQITGFCLAISACLFFSSCNTATPENYFDVAVLNTNVIQGFAGRAHSYELEHPSVKLDEKTNQPVPMTQTEAIEDKIKFTESMLDRLHGLKVTPDTKDIVETSKALYTYILPAYKTDYKKLAKLYESGAGKEEIETLTASIHEKYFPRYDELYSKLISHGKLFAERHAIKVNWAM